MITEDYCSYEVAKLLDKKGFREYCEAIYFILENGDYRWSKIDIPIIDCSICKPTAILCPTHQMAMKWLREECDLHIIAYPYNANGKKKWCCQVYKAFNLLGNEKYVNETLDSYEEAVEAALKYCLATIQIYERDKNSKTTQ